MPALQTARSEVQRSDRKKPKPSEPWRYTCQNCGSVGIVTVRGTGFTNPAPFYCEPCGTSHTKLYDRKADKEVTKGEIRQ